MKYTLLIALLFLTTTTLVLTQDVPAPTETSAPAETVAPEDTVAPSETSAPAETVAPEDTSVPAETTAPAETVAPSETTAPAETSAPAETTAQETTAPAETMAPSETTVAPAGNETAGNETDGGAAAGNETAGNETDGGAAAGNETAGNETVIGARAISANDSVLVLIGYQEGWMNSSAGSNDSLQADVIRNLEALVALANAFNISTILVGQDNATYGNFWPQVSNISNSQQVWINQFGEWALINAEFQNALTATGKSALIIAALTADTDLVFNSIAAFDQGMNVWPIVDASPIYDINDFNVALQNLQVAGIQARTWLGLSKALLNSQPDNLSAVNQVWSNYLVGSSINTGTAPPPSGGESVPPADNSTSNSTDGGSGGRRRFL
eukprot:403336217